MSQSVLKTILMFCFAGLLLAGCDKEMVDPQSANPTLAAQGATDTVHVDPEVICGIPATGNLVDVLGRTGSGNYFGADTYGDWQLISTPSQMILQISMNRGWFVTKAAIYMGDDTGLPLNASGTINFEGMPYQDVVSPARNIYDAIWPKSTAMACPNTVWTIAHFTVVELDFLGNPINETVIFCEGTLLDNQGTQAIGYCAETCGPVAPPACEIPTPGPGDDLSAYACGNGNGSDKVTVCHIPPGNPANMQEICISVNALDAHILEFKPVNNPCMGHHSGCHIGPCDPCGSGTSLANASNVVDPCPGNGGNGGNNDHGRNR